MKRAWPLAALALLAVTPLALTAQERGARIYASGRARLGVMVKVQADSGNDKFGATISDVVPDSPADKAGIKDGDIITRFNGTSLASAKSDDDDESGPGAKLVELARKLEPGDTVKLDYRRDGASHTATVVAEKSSARTFAFAGPEMGGRMMIPRSPGMEPNFPREFRFPGFEGGPGNFRVWVGDRTSGLELADVNAGLGEYFGTSEGALVLDQPEDKTLPLKAGDVILGIDGRSVKSAEHVHRILGSYESGETVKFDVMRQKRKQTVTWTVPKREEGDWKMEMPKEKEKVELHRMGFRGTGQV
jgi:S1-C subfamily serine protease